MTRLHQLLLPSIETKLANTAIITQPPSPATVYRGWCVDIVSDQLKRFQKSGGSSI